METPTEGAAHCVLPFEYSQVVAAVESMEDTPAIEARVGDLQSSTIRYLTKENRYINVGLVKEGDSTKIVSNHNSFEVKAAELVEVTRYIHESLRRASIAKPTDNPFRKVQEMINRKKKAPARKASPKKKVAKATSKKGTKKSVSKKKKGPAKAASRKAKPLAKKTIAAKPKARVSKKASPTKRKTTKASTKRKTRR